MDKILIVEIGSVTTTATLFNLAENNPKFGGQSVTQTPPKTTSLILQATKKVLSQIGEADLSKLKSFYILVSSPLEWDKDYEELQRNLGLLNHPATFSLMDSARAIMNLGELILHEVGEFLIADVEGDSVTIYSILNTALQGDPPQREVTLIRGQDLGIYENATRLVAVIGEQEIETRYGRHWRELIKPVPSTVAEITLAAELTVKAVTEGLVRHFEELDHKKRCLIKNSQFQAKPEMRNLWIIGTGRALVELPNGIQAFRAGLKHLVELGHPLSLSDIPILIDRMGLIPALGVLAPYYPEGSWSLLLESLSVDS